MPTIRRSWGYAEDAVTGGSSYDDLVAGLVPDATAHYPTTGGSLEFNIERVDRDEEVRGRRARTRPRPFRAAPSMTVPINAYRSVLEKIARKGLGGTDTPTGTGPAAITHNLSVLGFGSTALPAIHTQLVRDDLNHKVSGCSVNRFSLAFPLDGEGTMEFELMGLFAAHFATAPPSSVFSGLSEDVMMLRDAQVFIDGASEVQSVIATGASAGTFTLTVPANTVGVASGTTAGIAFNATAAAVQSALELVVGAGNVVCAGGPLPGTAVSITFSAAAGGRDVPQLTATSTLTGGTAVVSTTTGGGAAIPDLQGFEFSFTNNMTRKWYARRNVVTQSIGTPTATYKLWYPEENKLGAAQDVTYAIQFGNVVAAQELARDFAQVQKFVFEVTGGPLATTPAASELLRITIFNGVHTGGGAEALTAREDMTARFEGGGFYSETDSADIKFEVVNSASAAIT